MGFMDEIRKLTRPYGDAKDDYDDYDDEDEGFDEEEPVAAPATPNPRRSAYTRPAPMTEAAPASRVGGGRVVNLNSNAQLQVVLVKPDRFDQVSDVADHLRDKKAVVLNLENTNKDVSRRLVDFLSGCAYALDGKIKKVALSTYLVTPYNVNVSGDLVDELESSGMYF